MEELTKVYIYLAVTLIFITFAVSPLYASVTAANTNSAKIHVKEIAGVINMVMASPSDNLAYSIDMPKNCHIEIGSTFVRLRYTEMTITEEILQKKGFSVSPTTIDCNSGRMVITKSEQTITVS
jgi:hypothetical protein